VAVLLALPVVYGLSVPPLCRLTYDAGLWQDSGPAWLRAYAAPYDFLGRRAPLKSPLEAYADWWFRDVFPVAPAVGP
jgi:hypothetical protein